ncbi:MAG: hypothetical protein QM736_23990 [Vicinamibacterales bacterium]
MWSPSHGNALTPSGYRNLFETAAPRVFGESALFTDVVDRGTLDLSRTDDDDTLDTEAALTLIASAVGDVFSSHAIAQPQLGSGEWRVNPLYETRPDGAQLALTLRFPSTDYEDEYGACRQYLPDQVTIDAAALQALQAGARQPDLDDLVRRRVIVELPRHYA